MKERTVTLQTADGPMDVFEAAPESDARGPGILVFQEAFGVNGHIRDICKRLASAGYVAAAPELFHRNGPGVVFGYDEFKKVLPTLAPFTNDKILMDARAAYEHLCGHAQVDRTRVASIGFCMGGFASMLAACHLPLAAAISFYGGGMTKERPGIPFSPLLEDFKKLGCQALLIFGGKDSSISATDIELIRTRLKTLGKEYEIIVYPEAGHGFLCEERPSYRAASAKEAWAKALDWLQERV